MDTCFCPKCNKHRPASLCVPYIDSRGRARKQCTDCRDRKSASTYATKGTLARLASQRAPQPVAAFA